MSFSKKGSCFLFVLLCSVVSACGGSSSGSDSQVVRVQSPESMQSYRAGDTIELIVETRDFQLQVPPDRADVAQQGAVGSLARTFTLSALLHDGVVHETEEEAIEHEQSGMEAEGEEHSEGHADEEQGDEAPADGANADEHQHPEGSEVAESDDGHMHSHDSDEQNPYAVQGHMHIYLDGAMGSEPHITSWSYQTSIVLPEDITPGTHSLRLELRDDLHRVVNPETDVLLYFEVVE